MIKVHKPAFIKKIKRSPQQKKVAIVTVASIAIVVLLAEGISLTRSYLANRVNCEQIYSQAKANFDQAKSLDGVQGVYDHLKKNQKSCSENIKDKKFSFKYSYLLIISSFTLNEADESKQLAENLYDWHKSNSGDQDSNDEILLEILAISDFKDGYVPNSFYEKLFQIETNARNQEQ